MEQGWDPEVKNFFVKILNTISLGLLWMLAGVTAGLYFKLAYRDGKPLWQVISYYVVLSISFLFLLRYFYRLWKKA